MKTLICFFMLVSSVSARDYIDPSKREKRGLKEEGETTSVSAGEKSSSIASTEEKERQYCACLSINKLYEKKRELFTSLVRKGVMEDDDHSLRYKLDDIVRSSKEASNKALYMHGLNKNEVQCDPVKLSYTKLKEFDDEIEKLGSVCRLMDS